MKKKLIYEAPETVAFELSIGGAILTGSTQEDIDGIENPSGVFIDFIW